MKISGFTFIGNGARLGYTSVCQNQQWQFWRR
jgi:hypothetical protein